MPTFPVGVAVHVDEEDAQGDHQLHHGAQSSPVFRLSDLRRVSRGRQHESSASETREEPGGTSVKGELVMIESLPSDQQHGHVLSKVEKEPTTNEGDGEGYEGPFLADEWEGDGWK